MYNLFSMIYKAFYLALRIHCDANCQFLCCICKRVKTKVYEQLSSQPRCYAIIRMSLLGLQLWLPSSQPEMIQCLLECETMSRIDGD